MDWIDAVLAACSIGLAIANYLARKQGVLPRRARKYLRKLPPGALEAALKYAAAWKQESDDGKRRLAAQYLQQAARRIGICLPDSIANLLVEWGYQLYKRRI